VVQVDVGGGTPPSPALAARLLTEAREHLGEDTSVRLTYRYELLID
jgi:hypothetical protein